MSAHQPPAEEARSPSLMVYGVMIVVACCAPALLLGSLL